MRLFVLVPAAMLCLAPLACGSSSTPNPNDPSQNQYGAGQPGQFNGGQPGQFNGGQPGQFAPGTQPGMAPAPGPAGPAPAPGPAPAAGGGGQATPIAPGMAAAATPLLSAMAAKDVQGMTAEGGAFAGQFQDGQTLEQPFNISAGKCYAVVAAGVGVQEVHVTLQLSSPIPGLPAVLAQDNGSGPTATLGGGGSCWKNPLPIGGPGKIVVKVRGQGMAIAQLYSK